MFMHLTSHNISSSLLKDVEGDAVVIRQKRQEYADSGWTNNQCILYSG